MKSKLATTIISFVLVLIIAVLSLFGLIIWEEIKTTEVGNEPENFQVEETISTKTLNENTIDENIKTPRVIENTEDPLKNIESNNVEETNSSIEIDKHFYNQLDSYAKKIYQGLVINKSNMKSGTYKVEFGNNFAPLLDTENGHDRLEDSYQSAIEAYMYDNPDVFYLSPKKMYLNIETTTIGSKKRYNVFINNGKEINYFIDEFSTQEQVKSAISRIENTKNEILGNATGNTYTDIKMVHDYLVNNIEYDKSVSKENIYNIYGALVNKEAVCEGYAKSFKYLMDSLNIPCTLIIGKGVNSDGNTENHAWNYVKLDGTWYAVDCTWDDPIIVGAGWISPMSKYKYFLKGSSTMAQDHTTNGQFTENGKIFDYPYLSTTDYKN